MDNDSLWSLNDEEVLLWQGRPAPRCYTFRHWLQALLGTALFLASSFWLMIGLQLVRDQEFSPLLLVVPALLSIIAFFVGPGQLLLARLRWEKIFYALTNQRLLVRNCLIGNKVLSFHRGDYKQHKQKKYGKQLVSLRLSFKGRPAVVLECLEHPDLFLQHLACQTDYNN